MNLAIQQIISRRWRQMRWCKHSLTAAGLKKPDISILSDAFLAEVKGMSHRNLAVELLRKLLSGEIKNRLRNAVRYSHESTGPRLRTIQLYAQLVQATHQA